MVFGFGRRKRYIETAQQSSLSARLNEQTEVEALKRRILEEQKIRGREGVILKKAGEKLRVETEKEKQEKIKRARGLGIALGKKWREFRPPEEDFTFHEQVLRDMFGRGEHIWGTKGQPVELNHDLNPRQRGDKSTAELFGFG